MRSLQTAHDGLGESLRLGPYEPLYPRELCGTISAMGRGVIGQRRAGLTAFACGLNYWLSARIEA